MDLEDNLLIDSKNKFLKALELKAILFYFNLKAFAFILFNKE